jgi:Tfp pilus assembly protein PilW
MNTIDRSRGQSLVEILLAVAIGVILIGSSSFLIGVSLRSYNNIRQH